MTKSMVAVLTAIITAVVSVGSTLMVIKYTDTDGTENEIRAEVQYEEKTDRDKNEISPYEIVGGQQVIEGENIYNFDIKSARITQNYDGEPTVVVTFSFTNTEDESKSLWDACGYQYPMVYQDGIELEHTSNRNAETDNFDWDDNRIDVKPRVTFDVELGFLLKNTTSDIETEIGIKHQDTKVSRTFKIS